MAGGSCKAEVLLARGRVARALFWSAGAGLLREAEDVLKQCFEPEV
jgi:hypothetical protein